MGRQLGQNGQKLGQKQWGTWGEKPTFQVVGGGDPPPVQGKPCKICKDLVFQRKFFHILYREKNSDKNNNRALNLFNYFF